MSDPKSDSRFNIPKLSNYFLGALLISQITIACQSSSLNNLDRVATILTSGDYGCKNLPLASSAGVYMLSCEEKQLPRATEVMAIKKIWKLFCKKIQITALLQ